MALGSLFATAIALTVKLMPKDLHVGNAGFATAFGGSGGAVFPFIVEAITQSKGVKSLPPVILDLLDAISALWLIFPRFGEEESGEEDDETEYWTDFVLPELDAVNKVRQACLENGLKRRGNDVAS